MSFLTVEWENLILANYIVNPKLTKSYIPGKTQLELLDNKY